MIEDKTKERSDDKENKTGEYFDSHFDLRGTAHLIYDFTQKYVGFANTRHFQYYTIFYI